jgi:hypothetical protein
MALPSGGQLRFGDIGTELGISISNLSLRSMSSTVGFSTPDSVSEFWGYINLSFIDNFVAGDPCSYEYFDIYYGNVDGFYYYYNGSSYQYANNYASYWYKYLYYEPKFDANRYEKWETSSASNFYYVEDILSPC